MNGARQHQTVAMHHDLERAPYSTGSEAVPVLPPADARHAVSGTLSRTVAGSAPYVLESGPFPAALPFSSYLFHFFGGCTPHRRLQGRRFFVFVRAQRCTSLNQVVLLSIEYVFLPVPSLFLSGRFCG